MTKIFLGAISLTLAIFCISLLAVGPRRVGVIENISGIPYPSTGSEHVPVLITEALAHTDIFLLEPVLGKRLELTITYRPINLTSLAVGVRQDSFWLSYGSKQEIYRAGNTPGVELDSSPGVKEARVDIPLTDKLQEADRSIDLMFFAEGKMIQWELHGLEAKVTYDWPTYRQFRNYAGSILKRERAL